MKILTCRQDLTNSFEGRKEENRVKAACIIRDTKVSIVPFNQVSAEHAYKEGEDDRSLDKWREVHRRAFAPDYKAGGLDFDENGDCVLEEFEVVYP